MTARLGTGRPTRHPAGGDPVAWHDAEHGGFAADLELFARLAGELPGAEVEDAAGHPVTAVDTDPAVLAALAQRAAERSLPVETVRGDARALDLGRTFPLVLAPMQLLHIAGGSAGRRRLLAAAARHLRRKGRLCAVVIEEPLPAGTGRPDPVPDVREVDGWVHSSLPTEIRIEEEGITMVRLRQLVAPDGTLTEATHTIHLDRFTLADLDRDADAAGLWVVGCERIPSTVEFEDSLAVYMEVRDG